MVGTIKLKKEGEIGTLESPHNKILTHHSTHHFFLLAEYHTLHFGL